MIILLNRALLDNQINTQETTSDASLLRTALRESFHPHPNSFHLKTESFLETESFHDYESMT
jgi:hypothetical protein